jgi:membrane protease YdiL (CAAX protease family)
MDRDQLNQIDNRILYLNLLFTQAILFIFGTILYFSFLRNELPLKELFHVNDLLLSLIIGFIFASIVILLDILLMKWLPLHYFDDGGINERIFRDLTPLQIALVAFLVALVEEWLFRGVLQSMIGILWTGLLFSLIHIRYLKKHVLFIMLLVVSFGLGILYEKTGSMWTVIFAHFVIDFCFGMMIRYKWFPQKNE